MLKALVIKQYREVFKGYYVNRKTGEGRSAAGVLSLFALYGVIMLLLCGVFYALFLSMTPLLGTEDFRWLYFAVAGLLSVMLGVFGSVFNTYAALYQPGDNEMLLSMPIPPTTLLLSRLLLTYGMSLQYSALVWLPAVLCAWLHGCAGTAVVLFDLLLALLIALFVTVLTCILGWAVAQIASRLKNKSFITVLLSLAFIGAYYFVCLRSQDFLMSLVANQEKVSGVIRTWGRLTYLLSRAAGGHGPSMLLYALVVLALALGCFVLLSRSYVGIVTKNRGEKKAVYRRGAGKARSVHAALLDRELRHFTSSAVYMLNCGLGVALLPAVAALLVWKGAEVRAALGELAAMAPELETMLPLAVVSAVAMVVGLDGIATPSVSLEGKSIWVVQSLPVPAALVLRAKAELCILLNALSALPSAAVICVVLGLGLLPTLSVLLFLLVFVCYAALLGLTLGVKMVNLSWTSETTVIKQSMNVIFSWLGGWGSAIACVGLCVLLRGALPTELGLVLAAALLALPTVLLGRWLRTRGAESFEVM